jgi:hypothetical protein
MFISCFLSYNSFTSCFTITVCAFVFASRAALLLEYVFLSFAYVGVRFSFRHVLLIYIWALHNISFRLRFPYL